MNRVANRLSNQKETSGFSIPHIAQDIDETTDSEEDAAMYTLGQKYERKERTNLNTYRLKRTTVNGTHASFHNRPNNPPNRRRRLISGWMRGVRGCIVCRQSDRSKDRHPREESSTAINDMNTRLTSALLTVSDMVFILDLYMNDLHEASGDEGVISE